MVYLGNYHSTNFDSEEIRGLKIWYDWCDGIIDEDEEVEDEGDLVDEEDLVEEEEFEEEEEIAIFLGR